jgi:hypothetical protein
LKKVKGDSEDTSNSSPNSKREDHLIKASMTVKDLMNTGDSSGLGDLLDEVCAQDATLSIYYHKFRNELAGLAQLKHFFMASVDAYPDMITIYKQVKFNPARGIVSILYYGALTEHKENPCVGSSRQEMPDVFLSDTDRAFETRIQEILGAGKGISKTIRGRIIFVMNTERTHFKSIVYTCRLVDVQEAAAVK